MLAKENAPGMEQHEVTPGLQENYNCERESSSAQKQTLVTLLIIIPCEWYIWHFYKFQKPNQPQRPDAFLLLFQAYGS